MQWTNIASFSSGEGAYTLASHAAQGDDVFAGGNFTQIIDPNGPTIYSALRNALWNGVAWSELLGTGGANGTVHVTAVGQPPEVLYVGGSFSEVALTVANNIASYDGVTWTPLAHGVNGAVLDVAVNRDALAPWAVIGGEFTQAFDTDSNAVQANHIVLWNGNWVTLGNGVDGPVRAVLPKISYFNGTYHGGIVVAGSFSNAFNSDGSSIVANSVAWFDWETQEWEAFGNGVTGGGEEVWAITEGTSFYAPVSQPNFYLGGSFTGSVNFGGSTVNCNNILYWNNDTDGWEAVGEGTDGLVRALALALQFGATVQEPYIYVGGDFLQSTNGNGSTVTTPYLAVWSQGESQWRGIEGGLDGPVHAITSDAVIGGEFTLGLTMGGTAVTMNRVGKFSLTEVPAWSSLGSTGSDDIVRALTSVTPCIRAGQIIYAGGDFVQIGRAIANRLALWHYVYQPCTRVASAVISGPPGGGSGSTKGIASGPECSPLSLRGSGTEVTLFDSLGFREIVSIDSLFYQQYFDLSVYDIDDPSNPLVVLDSLLIEQEDPGILTLVGVDDTSLYAPNPDGRSTSISVIATSFELEGNPPGDAQLIFVNGVTDASSVDIMIQGGAMVVDSLPYGEAADQVSLLPASYPFDVIRHSDGAVLASYTLDISGYGDQVVAMLLSGFVDPAANQNGPAMSLDVLATGVQVVDVRPSNEEGEIPKTFHLSQNHPNPFNPITAISYDLPVASFVELRVFDLLGREIATLVNQRQNPGKHQATFNGTNVASGVYFYRLEATAANGKGFSQARKMLVVK
jgi:hypothetical protein